MSSYKNSDKCTDIILDMISVNESAGNYNAVIGHVHASDDLGQYTLTEIYQLMSDLLAEGQPSTAVGRYQIIRKTLKSLQSRLKLSNDEYFTPELQDRLAITLLVGRGYSAWWQDRITDLEFMHNISCEWASLPDPFYGGKSHYDGIGPNHAGTTVQWVLDKLKEAKAQIGS